MDGESLREIAYLTDEDITQGRESNNEENVKIKIVVRLLHELGWEDKEIDFEPFSDAGKIDILLKIGRFPRVIIEVKSYEQDLKHHRAQVFKYAKSKDVKQFILTNGKIFEFFQIRGSWDSIDTKKLIPHLTILRKDLVQQEGVLRYYLGRTELGILSAYSTTAVNNDYLVLRKILSNQKIQLYTNLREKIVEQYNSDSNYHKKLDAWIKKIQWDQSWSWTENFSGRTKNKFLKRKVEAALK